MSKWDLDTPALCVDLDRLEHNIATMQAAAKRFGIATRPHAKTHKSADIAKMQLAAGAIGICAAKLGEADALMAKGVDRICMTTGNLSPAKIRRAMQLRKASSHFIQATDTEQNARDLSAAAREAGVTADVVIDVAVGTRSGIPPDDTAVALARLVDTLPNLKLRGLLSYDGGAQHISGFATRKARSLANIEANAKVRDAMHKAGLDTGIFSGGGTGTYNLQHLVPGFTDMQVGSYVFMDMQYLAIGSEDGNAVYNDFASSLTVVGTVVNNRFPGRLTTDAGAKALTLNLPARRRDRRARRRLQRRLRRVRRDHLPQWRPGQVLQDRRPHRDDRPPLRSRREPLRRDVRDPERQGGKGDGRHRAGTVPVATAAAADVKNPRSVTVRGCGIDTSGQFTRVNGGPCPLRYGSAIATIG